MMMNSTLDKEMIHDKLKCIVSDIAGIEVEDVESSLFSFKYNLSAEGFVYLLLQASKKFDFEMNDELISSLTSYSLADLADAIKCQLSN